MSRTEASVEPAANHAGGQISRKPRTELESVTVRFAGDSGDGMQLAGAQLTNTSALAGNDVATFADFPAEIRAPRGSRAGVSGFQLHFASRDVYTPGDRLDALIAMNPAALRENVADLQTHGMLIVDSDTFDAKGLQHAGFEANPLDDGSLNAYQVLRVPITKLTREAVEGSGLGRKLAGRCRNFFAMGLVYWVYGRSLEPTLEFIEERFGADPEVAEGDRRSLRAGWSYGETTEALSGSYHVPAARLAPGTYRNITGNQALAWGLISAARLSDKALFYASYPITPASDVLHELSRYKHFGVRTFQAEDEIAVVTSAIGAAFGGAMAATASSGPGITLKAEAMGLAVMLELPMIVVCIQRGGPSTGLPTKTEQTDLTQVLHGRSGEAPLPVLAASGPADCFDIVLQAWRIATRLMTPVVILSDAHTANSAEPWRIPEVDELAPIPVAHAAPRPNGEPFQPYARDELLARPWALPGTPGLMHRIGGLEKQDVTGEVSYDPDNHEHMVRLRASKVDNAAALMPELRVEGPERGPLLVLSWGGTYGACVEAVAKARRQYGEVSHAHLRCLHPFPRNLGDILGGFDQVLVPELNLGQLRSMIRARYLVDASGVNKINGRPFSSTEILSAIEAHLG